MKNLILTYFILSGLLLFGQNDINTGIIYGNNHAYSLTAPDGWILDIQNGKDITIKDSEKAQVKYISGKSYGNYEAIAYIDAGKTGILIIMSSRNKEGFKSSLSAFNSLVKSYLFLSEKVQIETNK